MKKILSIIICLFIISTIANAFAETKLITYEELTNYGQLFESDGNKGTEPIRIEAVIGRMKTETDSSFPDTYIDLWIKGENGYGYMDKEIMGVMKKETSFPHELVSGQRVIYELTPYVDGSFSAASITSYEIIEEGVDYEAIEEQYKATNYEQVSYKKLLRNIDDYKGKPICAEGIYLQEANSESSYIDGLLMDDDGNIYCFVFLPERLQSRILLNDRLKVYGHIAKKQPTYKYLSLTGNREVPQIWVDFIDILEEE